MSKEIRKIFEPDIIISDIRGVNDTKIESPNLGSIKVINDNIDMSKYIGLTYFMIYLNGKIFDLFEIDVCEVDCNGKYPKITLRIRPDETEFLTLHLPKDGDILSVFYKSKVELLKPIRMDFIVTDCIPEIEADTPEYIIHGVINIPNLFKDSSFVYEGDSIQVTSELAKKLKLGYATNINNAKDKQKWMCASKPFDSFIDDIKYHSYYNDSSFFDTYIDNYYILNHINIWEQLTYEKENKLSYGIYKYRSFLEAGKESEIKINEDSFIYKDFLHLSNSPTYINDFNRIESLKVISSTSRISLEEGYNKYQHFYDYTFDSKLELLNESSVTDELADFKYHMKGGVFDKEWKKNTRHTWGGYAYNLPVHNTHQYYQKAELQNHQNLKEIDKLVVEVLLSEINFNIYRYQIIPLIYYHWGESARVLREVGGKFNNQYDELESPDGFPKPMLLNKFLTGYYLVKGMKYINIGASPGHAPKVVHQITLTKMEWDKAIYITDMNNTPLVNINN